MKTASTWQFVVLVLALLAIGAVSDALDRLIGNPWIEMLIFGAILAGLLFWRRWWPFNR